jgi:hypothetical protein
LGVAAWLLVIGQASACASDPVFEDGRYRQRRYSIAHPGGEDSAWERVRVDGAGLVFQGPGRASMSLLEHCGRPLAKPRILARQLLIGLDGRKLIAAGPLHGDETRGWVQRFEATADGKPLQLKTVTRVIEDCSYDWILIVPDELTSQEAVFDAWTESFRAAAAEGGGEGGG